MTSFEEIRHDYYHRVSVAPNERRPDPIYFSDIVLHLPVLEYYASLCDHVTEFGVRDANSTVALISGCKGVVNSYDIDRSPMTKLLATLRLPCAKWEFFERSTIDPTLSIPVTDFLFIDTLHTFEHVSQELSLHGRKTKRFLGFHDTYTCGDRDLSGPDQNANGILPAIHAFLAKYPDEYRTVYRTNVNNGLWILERVAL